MPASSVTNSSATVCVVACFALLLNLLVLLWAQKPLACSCAGVAQSVAPNLTGLVQLSAGNGTELKSSVDLSQRFVIGITTVSRPSTSYLNSTLHSLQCALDSDGVQPTVLVLNGDAPPLRHVVFESLWQQPAIRRFMRNGLVPLQLPELHQPLQAAKSPGGLPHLPGHSSEQIWWRSKENLDKAHLIESMLNVTTGQSVEYYIQFEDDVRFAPHLLSKLWNYIQKQQRLGIAADVISLFGTRHHKGGVAIAYKVTFLRDFVFFLRSDFVRLPYDWALDDFAKQRNLAVHIIEPNLVQHKGTFSSLKERVHSGAYSLSATFDNNGRC